MFNEIFHCWNTFSGIYIYAILRPVLESRGLARCKKELDYYVIIWEMYYQDGASVDFKLYS